ncbi:hypothetical protein C723_0809 [Christiangramia flava JLT2011]|uniref:Uncharacterized protein n=1 Tax=Christiangramia flava JLT2011 TaxID=1229726 RepID=A0A1L7I327_9FLAO|nr:hypothetical protein GRFL_1276 [Christiangramia flava JLT2011]OSS40501.1 hypothetical protein C723_0809 [Christiangramia flava JLT2011]
MSFVLFSIVGKTEGNFGVTRKYSDNSYLPNSEANSNNF